MRIKPLDANLEIVRYWNHLPHWRQNGVTYFVTFRLGDSIPQAKLRMWKDERKCWMEAHGLAPEGCLEEVPDLLRKEYHRRFTKRFHDWLDAGIGECLLRHPQVAEVMKDALHHFTGKRYDLGSWVVMPHHVHVLLSPLEGHGLSDIMHSWKGFTAHEINRMLERKGPVWQSESYDHIVRSKEQFVHYQRYIKDNPVKAKLSKGEYLLSDVECDATT